jgi:hypothetical protein
MFDVITLVFRKNTGKIYEGTMMMIFIQYLISVCRHMDMRPAVGGKP